MSEVMFDVRDLVLDLPDMNAKSTFGATPKIRILNGLSFTVQRGEVFGIVGESGSGKSTLARCLVRLYKPTSGQILFDGNDVASISDTEFLPLRQNIQMIFQDPMSSLNPRLTIGQIIAAPLKLHQGSRQSATDIHLMVAELMTAVQLDPALAVRYPHQLSGGQRQRVGIARALALNPTCIVADEIVSGLDVSTQAQILDLLQNIAIKRSLTILFISHDLSIIRRLCHHVMVMQSGLIVEQGPTRQIFDKPRHEYTRTLLEAIPLPELDSKWLT
ncbi:MAG: ATP-binding cassette domain-containing protein [Bacteroidetes bacterium]|nr:ATP-binding cassette domain-containing protein [Bacteroidota bacterium]